MGLRGIVEVTSMMGKQGGINSKQSRCENLDLYTIAIVQHRKPPQLMAGECQRLIWYSRTIAAKGDLGHFERMDE